MLAGVFFVEKGFLNDTVTVMARDKKHEGRVVRTGLVNMMALMALGFWASWFYEISHEVMLEVRWAEEN